MHVLVYTTPTCPYCHTVKQFLTQKRIPFVERDVASDPQAAREMVQRSGQQGVPVTIVDDEVIVGFDRPRLEHILAQAAASGPVRLGASVADAAHVSAASGGGVLAGAYVGGVKAGSIAAHIGLREGDLIVELAGRTIRTARDIETALGGLRRGQPATLSYVRNGHKQQIQFVP